MINSHIETPKKWSLWIGRLLAIIIVAIVGAQGAKGSENLDAVGGKAGSSERPTSLTAGRLLGFSFVDTQRACRAELLGDGRITGFKCFTLDDPRRIVLDIQGLRHPFNNHSIDVGSKIVAQLRIGIHPSKVRFVFDIEKGLDRWPSHVIRTEKSKLVLSIRIPETEENRLRTTISSAPKLQVLRHIQKVQEPGADGLHTVQEAMDSLGAPRLRDEELSSIRAE